MGRGKLTLKQIDNEKSRLTTYQKRKKGLKKKVQEFATLCGVPTAMIVFGPKLNNRPVEVDVWPAPPSPFMEVIELYKCKSLPSTRGMKSYTLVDYFQEKKQKVQDKLNKIRKSNLESRFCTSLEQFNVDGFTLDELKSLVIMFDDKIKSARRRIGVLMCAKEETWVGSNNQLMAQPLQFQFPEPIYVPPFDQGSNQVVINGGDQFCQFGYSEIQPTTSCYFDQFYQFGLSSLQMQGQFEQFNYNYNHLPSSGNGNNVLSSFHGCYHQFSDVGKN